MAGYNNIINAVSDLDRTQNKSFFSKILKDLSNWGQKTDDMIIRNTVSINMYDDLSTSSSTQEAMLKKANSLLIQQQPMVYFDYTYVNKLNMMRQYAVKDEIRDFISTVADDTITYNNDKMFCTLSKLSSVYNVTTSTKLEDTFQSIYNIFKFNDGICAWEYFKQLLVDGFLVFEMVFDDKLKNIIGFVRIDPSTILATIDPETGKKIWIQYPDNPQYRKILLDSQIIYISYSTTNTIYSEISYVEPLIRPYNQYELLLQTRLMFNLMNATIHKKYSIPIGDMTKDMAEQYVGQFVSQYKDDVAFDDYTGQLRIDGKTNIPYSKEIYLPVGSDGTKPDYEFINPEGHNLNESEMLTFFYNKLKRASKIPFSRFEKDNGGGSIYYEGTEPTHDDNNYNAFIGRLRAIYREILLKPIYIQMVLNNPELKNDESFKSDLNIIFYGNEMFEQFTKINNWDARTNKAVNMMGIMNENGVPYFHPQWIVRNVLGLTEKEIKENAKYFKTNPITSEDGELQDDFGGGGDDFSGSDFGGASEGAIEGADDFGGGDDVPETPEIEPQNDVEPI